MARTKAIATDPVLFYRGGVLEELPLKEIYFDGTSAKTDRVTGPNDPLAKWLDYLVAVGVLRPASSSAAATALTATAQRAGSSSNHITLKIEPTSDTNKVKVSVTQVDIYASLTIATLVARLGNGTITGSDDGLLQVKSNPAGAPDPNGTVTQAAGPIWTIADDGTTKVTLELKDKTTANLDKVTFTVTVIDVTPAAGGATFTLRVEAKASVDNVQFGATFPTAKLGELTYLVKFAAATTTAPFALPRPTTITLSGGTDQIAARAATAPLLASG